MYVFMFENSIHPCETDLVLKTKTNLRSSKEKISQSVSHHQFEIFLCLKECCWGKRK